MKTKLILLSLTLLALNLVGQTQSTTKNDSIYNVVHTEQLKFQKVNTCPSCPWQIVSQYLNFIKTGNISKANALVYYGDCKKDCAMPMLKGTYDELIPMSDDVKKSFGNVELNEKNEIIYIDKDNCVIYNYIKTSASLHIVAATKVNGVWKLDALNREMERDYIQKARKALIIPEMEYFKKLQEPAK